MFLQTGLSATTVFYYIITVTEFEKILALEKRDHNCSVRSLFGSILDYCFEWQKIMSNVKCMVIFPLRSVSYVESFFLLKGFKRMFLFNLE